MNLGVLEESNRHSKVAFDTTHRPTAVRNLGPTIEQIEIKNIGARGKNSNREIISTIDNQRYLWFVKYWTEGCQSS